MANELNFNNRVTFGGTDPLKLPSAASDPVSATNGDMYYNTTTNLIRAYQNGAWGNIASSGSGVHIEIFTLSGTDISNKYVTLAGTPTTPGKTQLDVIGGIRQAYTVDFTSSGTQLSWSSLGLDGILSTGDILVVQYD